MKSRFWFRSKLYQIFIDCDSDASTSLDTEVCVHFVFMLLFNSGAVSGWALKPKVGKWLVYLPLEYLNYRNGQGYLTDVTQSAILDHQNGLHCWYQSKGKATISCLFYFEKMHLLSETKGKIDRCKVLENQTSGMLRMLKVSRKSYAGLIDQELFLANHDFYFFMLIGQYKIYDLSFINSPQG